MKIKIVIADDHRIVREGLSSMIGAKPDIEVVGLAKNGREALRLTQERLPDVVVMDVAMPDLNGVEATRQILQEAPTVKVVGLSMHSDVQFISKMLGAGALGYVLKDAAFEELATAIRTVASGKAYLSPGISDLVLQDYVQLISRKRETDSVSPLSPREREILQLLAEGSGTKDIALRLHVSAKTVESHRRQIMEKLNVHNIAGLTKYAVREGLTFIEE